MAKHLPKEKIRQIGNDRVEKLTSLQIEEAKSGKEERAKNYIDLALKICGKTKVKMPKDFRYCKKCFSPLLPGINCSVRLSSHKVAMRCLSCGNLKRRPYLREQEHE